MKSFDINIVLVDPYHTLCEEWNRAFDGLPNVEIINGVFEEQEFDCIVTAANSFGLMDGGIDAAMVNFFGEHVQQIAQETIIEKYRGEQPVGTSFIIETGSKKHPYLAHTPTMRIPMNISNTFNSYLAFRAALLEVWRFNEESNSQIIRLACPGLGTAIGSVKHSDAANQMAQAYRSVLYPPQKLDWPYALESKSVLLPDNVFDYH